MKIADLSVMFDNLETLSFQIIKHHTTTNPENVSLHKLVGFKSNTESQNGVKALPDKAGHKT